jgi:hypothetical protein
MVLMTYVALSMLGLPMHRLGGCEHSEHPVAESSHEHPTDETSNCRSEPAAAASPSGGTTSRVESVPSPHKSTAGQKNNGHNCTCSHSTPSNPSVTTPSKSRTVVGTDALPNLCQSSSTLQPESKSEWNAEHHHAHCVVCEQIRSLSQHVVIGSSIGMAWSTDAQTPSPIRLPVESNRERATLSSRGPPVCFA